MWPELARPGRTVRLDARAAGRLGARAAGQRAARTGLRAGQVVQRAGQAPGAAEQRTWAAVSRPGIAARTRRATARSARRVVAGRWRDWPTAPARRTYSRGTTGPAGALRPPAARRRLPRSAGCRSPRLTGCRYRCRGARDWRGPEPRPADPAGRLPGPEVQRRRGPAGAFTGRRRQTAGPRAHSSATAGPGSVSG